MPNKKLLIKKYLIIASLIIFSIGGSYTFGTFKPNNWVVQDIQIEAETKHALWAKNLGLHSPSMNYKTQEQFVIELKRCVDFLNFQTPPNLRVPLDMLVAQAVLESGWGSSRFANEANNLFGIRTWDKDKGVLPKGMSENTPWRVRKFETKCDSVQEYMNLLNFHSSYSKFRELRTKFFKNNQPLDAVQLIKTLDAFSTTSDYDKRVIEMMSTVETVMSSKEWEKIDKEHQIEIKKKPDVPEKKLSN
jgi:Bax protein